MKKKILLTLAVMLLTLAAPVSHGEDAAAPPGGDLPAVRMVQAFPKLTFKRPMFLTHAGDNTGRLFVIEQDGRILVFSNREDVAETVVFLDVTAKTTRVDNEEGLLAVAFDPGFAKNGFLYVWYSAANPRRHVLSRFRVSANDSNKADPASEKILLEHEKPYGNHNGSTVLFGPDGYLYFSVGDGGAGNDPHGNGQKLSTLLAKINRIDVSKEEGGRRYAIPKDNPFIGKEGARPEIYAYGLRNAWRMSFDRKTGQLWAGDVGQDKWEEVNIIVNGGNYGWNIRESKHAFFPRKPKAKKTDPDPPEPPDTPAPPGMFVDPITEYHHKLGASITGGYVYRGKKMPRLEGMYIFGDYVSGKILALRHAGGKAIAQGIILSQTQNISSFGEDAEGELYVLTFNTTLPTKIYRLEEDTAAGQK